MKVFLIAMSIMTMYLVGCSSKSEKECLQTGFWDVNRTSTTEGIDEKQFDLFAIVNDTANQYSLSDFLDPGSKSVSPDSYFEGCRLHLIINGDVDGQDYTITRDYLLSGSNGEIVTGNAETVIGEETIDWTAAGTLSHFNKSH